MLHDALGIAGVRLTFLIRVGEILADEGDGELVACGWHVRIGFEGTLIVDRVHDTECYL